MSNIIRHSKPLKMPGLLLALQRLYPEYIGVDVNIGLPTFYETAISIILRSSFCFCRFPLLLIKATTQHFSLI
jgi:hypothetical protein